MTTARTGTGTTITGSITSFTLKITGVDPFQIALDKIEASNMSSTLRKRYIPADLAELGDMNVDVEYDGSVTIDDALGVVQEWTINVGNRGAGHKIIGTGFISGLGAQIPLNDKMTGNITIAWDGDEFEMAAA